ncbi:hypothetical protein [Ornithinimicrobium kibberense]|uniref:hypothetical protein n=1 Tax=Ornithinimicrobium kibberense TaxID=282060 RepID=UPI00361AA6AB
MSTTPLPSNSSKVPRTLVTIACLATKPRLLWLGSIVHVPSSSAAAVSVSAAAGTDLSVAGDEAVVLVRLGAVSDFLVNQSKRPMRKLLKIGWWGFGSTLGAVM